LLLLHHSLTHPLTPELCHLTPRACARGRVSAIFATAKSICANNKSVSTAGIALSLSKHCLPNGHLYVCAAAEDQGVEAWAAAFIDGAAGGLATTGGGGPRTRIIRASGLCAHCTQRGWATRALCLRCNHSAARRFNSRRRCGDFASRLLQKVLWICDLIEQRDALW
jgi:hypothetical protein